MQTKCTDIQDCHFRKPIKSAGLNVGYAVGVEVELLEIDERRKYVGWYVCNLVIAKRADGNELVDIDS